MARWTWGMCGSALATMAAWEAWFRVAGVILGVAVSLSTLYWGWDRYMYEKRRRQQREHGDGRTDDA